jgi:poly(3-hydroxybutyrate) depolymerase
MLYDAYEFRRGMVDRMGHVLGIPGQVVSSIPEPLVQSYPVRTSLAAAQVVGALQLSHERPDFRIRAVLSSDEVVEVSEDVVASTPFGSLIRFLKADGSSAVQPKVLIVPGLAGHFATLVRGTVSAMLVDHDVYVVDWHNARDVPAAAGRFGLDEYIEHLMTFLRHIGPGTHVVGVCQPAVACLAAASIMAEDQDPAQPSSLILIAGPVDTRVNPSRLSNMAERQSLKMLERLMVHTVPSKFAGAGRRVYPGFLQIGGFMSMDPRRHMAAFRGMFKDLRRGHEKNANKTMDFYQEYFAVLDIAAEFYLETAQRIFKSNDLARGAFQWKGRRVDPSLIESALFTIEGELDEMCCPGQTEAAHALCSGIPPESHKHLLQEGVGHYGVFAGTLFVNEIYPQIREFIASAAKRVQVA